MNASGRRRSTIEIESALVAHEAVAKVAAATAPDELTGQTPLSFVVLRAGYEPSYALAAELREWVGKQVGQIARPKAVIFGADLPKTRSGKIMRRLLKDIAGGNALGDTTTLRDPEIVRTLEQEANRLPRWEPSLGWPRACVWGQPVSRVTPCRGAHAVAVLDPKECRCESEC